MCQTCAELRKEALAKGITDEQFMFWYWERTPLPIGLPTDGQVAELMAMAPKRKDAP